MALTSRRRRPLDRTVAHLRDTRLIIIAAEGRKTERDYFTLFGSTRVQVRVLPTGEDNRSAPEQVLARLDGFAKEYQLGLKDQLWLMVDVDRWRSLPVVAQAAIAKGYGLAVSNPCFEIWLLCHFELPSQALINCELAEARLRTALGGSYNKSSLDAERFRQQIAEAVATAKALDAEAQPSHRWPSGVGTHVYRVVEAIEELLR